MLLAGGMTVLVFFLLNPYAILDFKDYLFADNAFGFFHILRNIRGENLYPFQIQFMDNNFPLVSLFSNLLPWGMGWPLALLGGVGAVIQIVRGRSADWILLIWLLVTLLLTHNAKVLYIRYALPLMPLLVLSGVRGIALLWEWRPVPKLRYFLSLLVLSVWVYGLAWSAAFNSVYAQEDSRLAAARWLGQNVSHGTTVLHEQSANSMKFYLEKENYDLLHLSIHMLYRSGGLLTFQERIDYLYHKLAMADYFIFVDTNRMAGYQEVSNHFPVESDFYNLLLSGKLGYELVFDRKMHPEMWGWEIDDTEAEFSLRYYDHSRTFILRKTDSFSRDLFDRWRDLYNSAPGTQDELIKLAQQQIAQGQWDNASTLLGQGLNNQQGLITKLRLLGDCALAQGDTAVAHQAYESTLQYDRLQPQISYQYYIQFLLSTGERAEAERAYAGLREQLGNRRAEVKALERFWAEATGD
jgi:tetratricopeptide (TPR) repeat protein